TACASVTTNGTFGGQVTATEIQAAYYQYTASLETIDVISKIAADLDALIASTYDFNVSASAYQGQIAAFTRAIAVTDQTMSTMSMKSGFDPPAWFFEDQDMAAMRASFRLVAEEVRDVHGLVEYGVGHAIPEHTVFSLDSTKYCLPRLSE